MDSKQNRERMESGKLYFPADEAVMAEQTACMERLWEYNHTRPSEGEKRARMLEELFAHVGKNAYIEPPLRANWGGARVRLGDNFYANFNLTLVDDADISFGDNCMVGPNVTIATASHPILPQLRCQLLQYNLPVRIGDNVWIGAGAILLPGVTVGDGSVIGAGSVVTKDVPGGVVAAGNPCRVLREIGDRDREYYYKNMRVDL